MVTGILRAIAGVCGLVPGWLWALLVAGAAAHTVWVGFARDRAVDRFRDLEAAVARQEAARAKVALEANSNFRKFEHQQATAAAEIESALQTRHLAAKAADDRNRDRVDGLLRTIARLDAGAGSGGMPSAAACPAELAAGRRAAQNARAVLGACAAEYRSLGGAAAVDAADLEGALTYGDLVSSTKP